MNIRNTTNNIMETQKKKRCEYNPTIDEHRRELVHDVLVDNKKVKDVTPLSGCIQI